MSAWKDCPACHGHGTLVISTLIMFPASIQEREIGCPCGPAFLRAADIAREPQTGIAYHTCALEIADRIAKEIQA